MDVFAPRKALAAHLQKLVDQKIIRGVAHAEDFADVMDGRTNANHGFVYVVYDKSSNIATQGRNSIRSTETYTLILAWQNNRQARSGYGHGMDEAGEIKDAIEFHVHGYAPSGEYHSKSTGKPFMLTDSPEAFYRPAGWAFYPMSFAIDIIRTRT